MSVYLLEKKIRSFPFPQNSELCLSIGDPTVSGEGGWKPGGRSSMANQDRRCTNDTTSPQDLLHDDISPAVQN